MLMLCMAGVVHAAENPPLVATPEGKAPGDAVVVFDGTGKEALVNARGQALSWPVTNGELVVTGEMGAFTKHHFQDAQIHVEFLCPNDGSEGGNAGNSGVYLHGLYEIQIHNSYDYPLDPKTKGILGSVYGQHLPLVNPARPVETWQVYDIIFRAPRRGENGAVIEPGTITAFLNGVLVHDGAPITKPTVYGPMEFRATPYAKEVYAKIKQNGSGPLFLQDHHSTVRFRNIWIRDL